MSLTCHEEIGRVGRVGRGRYEDVLTTCPQQVVRVVPVDWRTTRHTDKLEALYTAADRRPTNQVSAWQAER